MGQQDWANPPVDIPPWFIDAKCLDADPEAFFPDKGGSVEPAIAICELCPIQQRCLDWAVENRQDKGVWGGMSEKQRTRYRMRREQMRRSNNGH